MRSGVAVYGPESLALQASSITAILKVVKEKKQATTSNTVQVNTAPRAGQQWNISNVFFQFPEAIKEEKSGLASEFVPLEYEFDISMLIGGVVVAEQKFIELGVVKPEVSFPSPIVGSLEPFAPAIVYPGQSIEITYRVSVSSKEPFPVFSGVPVGEMTTGLGNLLLNYSLYA